MSSMICENCKYKMGRICYNIYSPEYTNKTEDVLVCEFHENKEKASKETVNHPEHYNKGIEAIDIIESWGLNFSLGNAIKYIIRAPYKGNQVEDLKKAKWYIEREIERLENITK